MDKYQHFKLLLLNVLKKTQGEFMGIFLCNTSANKKNIKLHQYFQYMFFDVEWEEKSWDSVAADFFAKYMWLHF